MGGYGGVYESFLTGNQLEEFWNASQIDAAHKGENS